jgi:tRNA A-37 threonylcarbamoyl transferase component Bud32
MYNRQQSHATDIAVLKATATANKEAHDREFKQIQDSFKAVFLKLDDIERALRK